MHHPQPAEHPQLPLEVQLLILDAIPEAFQDRAATQNAIRSCAETCQAWLSRARFHLYHTVHLRSHSQCYLLSRTLTENAAIATLIQHIHYTDTRPPSAFGYREMLQDPPLSMNTVSKLSSLRSAAFTFDLFTPTYFLPFVQSFSVLKSLDSLCLKNVITSTYAEIVNLLWSFPTVRAVELDRCLWYKIGSLEDLSTYPGHYRNLRALKIRHVEEKEMCQYLHIFEAAEGLTSLLFLSHLDAMDNYDGLHEYSQLETLHLGTSNTDPSGMAAALSNVRSSKLRRISLAFKAQGEPFEALIQQLSDSRLDDMLSTAPFLGLDQLIINVISDVSPGDAEGEIARALPRCHGRGILNFNVQYQPRAE
ncbi:hypothetical protein L226DRAFT_561037 [Lentinus tigrinus ALCF2SS1-7]|uniref:F-box domain-containing protein n=1 Tax=Lentinus tigrinus ALCF2SS1-6 TaxID=1328759 RepID=A0A5C2RYH3_9APHY|nr:hypothetical protein L227DRAFT_603150 [Lentinus tigrinus ALCF2SS1-6]RPD74029.1 hypothetical protein L226DRAFT_561037 [Lentinus tigrinus ALCF2SS1-7]